jgi:DNA-binding transcriptional ArsR family regulator
MNEHDALDGFAALSQPTRLGILRLLVPKGAAGCAAGEIAAALDVSASNISFHLKEMERARLVAQRREARSIIYAVNYATLRDLIGFLMHDCCGGRPEICAPLTTRAACAPRRNRQRSHVASRS